MLGRSGKDIQAQIVLASACTIMGVRPDASASSRPTACRCAASSLALTQATAAICHPRSASPSICSAMDVVSPSAASTARTCAARVASERSSQR